MVDNRQLANIEEVVLIGAGAVATQLGKALHQRGKQIVQIYNRTANNAEMLAKELGAKVVDKIEGLYMGADIYIVAVSDDAIALVASRLRLNGKLVVHTSGATPLSVLCSVSPNAGVFYIPQTFIKHASVSFENLPICIEASNEETLIRLRNFALCLSCNILEVNFNQRSAIHLAAVMVSNFTNALYAIADEILDSEQISLSILYPLIEETVQKTRIGKPKDLQTGPAKRGDSKTIQRHMSLLKKKEHKDLYALMSAIIEKEYQ